MNPYESPRSTELLKRRRIIGDWYMPVMVVALAIIGATPGSLVVIWCHSEGFSLRMAVLLAMPAAGVCVKVAWMLSDSINNWVHRHNLEVRNHNIACSGIDENSTWAA